MATMQNEQTIFLWEGRDKRGVRLKGQQVANTPEPGSGRIAPPGH